MSILNTLPVRAKASSCRKQHTIEMLLPLQGVPLLLSSASQGVAALAVGLCALLAFQAAVIEKCVPKCDLLQASGGRYNEQSEWSITGHTETQWRCARAMRPCSLIHPSGRRYNTWQGKVASSRRTAYAGVIPHPRTSFAMLSMYGVIDRLCEAVASSRRIRTTP